MANRNETQREWVGQVVSDKMNKTVVVAISRVVRHPFYQKVMRRVTTLKAHDEKNECKVGDRVRLIETRPISKEKHWRVVQIVERGRAE